MENINIQNQHTVNVPYVLIWNNEKYYFSGNKGNILCYSYKGDINNSGSLIVVEYRPTKRYIDQFLVLFSVNAIGLWNGNGNVQLSNMRYKSRQAVPIDYKLKKRFGNKQINLCTDRYTDKLSEPKLLSEYTRGWVTSFSQVCECVIETMFVEDKINFLDSIIESEKISLADISEILNIEKDSLSKKCVEYLENYQKRCIQKILKESDSHLLSMAMVSQATLKKPDNNVSKILDLLRREHPTQYQISHLLGTEDISEDIKKACEIYINKFL